MNATNRLFLSNAVTGHIKEAITAGDIANEGTYWIPGVNTLRYGYDAANSLANKHWLGALGNLGMGALSIFPGAGTAANKGLGFLARGLGWGARAARAPKLAERAIGLGERIGKPLLRMDELTSSALSRIPGGKTILAKPALKYGIPSTGIAAGNVVNVMGDANAERARLMDEQQRLQQQTLPQQQQQPDLMEMVRRLLPQIASNPAVSNPFGSGIGGGGQSTEQKRFEDWAMRMRRAGQMTMPGEPPLLPTSGFRY